MKAKANSFDIAFHAGVSQSTVSRALRGSPLVSLDTQRRVREIATQLNYKVDKHASALRRQSSGTLALLLFEDPTCDDSQINPFFVAMLASVARACARQGYDLMVSFQQAADDWHAEYQDSHKADGLILLGYGDYLVARSKLEKLESRGTHFVRWGAVVEGQPGLSVGCDNVQGARDLCEHLLHLGHRRIAFLGNATEHCPEFRDRYAGYCQALRAAGIAIDPALHGDATDSTEEVGRQAMVQLLERGAKPDAVLAASDLLAIGALHTLESAGISVPGEVAVAGFDDIPMARLSTPALTTVQQDTKRAGEVLVERLLQRIRGEPTMSEMLPARLVIRRSCGADGGS